jgi:hypothetical protein
MFICYLARDKQLALEMRNKGVLELSEAITYDTVPILLQELVKRTAREKDILAEVPREEEYSDLRDVFKYQHRLFDAKAYILDIEYLQPSLDMSNPASTPTHDLLYMPGPESQRVIDVNQGKMPRQMATDILDFIYNRIYIDSSDTSDEGQRQQAQAVELLERCLHGIADKDNIRLVQLSPW